MAARDSSRQAKAAQSAASFDWMSAAPRTFLAQTAQAALLGLDAFEANLRIWRAAGAALNEMGERQQDAALQHLRTRLLASTATLAPDPAMSGASAAGA
jgi:hypothetical protein